MVSGSRGTKPLSELGGTLLKSYVLKWPAPEWTLRAWLPASRLLTTDSSSWMGKVRRRTEKLLSTLLLEEYGTSHEERAHSAFQVGDTSVRCGEGVEDLEHIVHHCQHWNKERRESCLPSHVLDSKKPRRVCGFMVFCRPPGAGCSPSP
eukprot:4721881-Amphidinium_carterae.2